jgi:hypothetical protein
MMKKTAIAVFCIFKSLLSLWEINAFYKKREFFYGYQFKFISFMKYSNNIMKYNIVFNNLKFIW